MFILDFVLAVTILFAFLIYIRPIMQASPNDIEDIKNYADESMSFLENCKVAQLDYDIRMNITEDYRCSSCSVAEQLSILMVNDLDDSALGLANSTLKTYIPNRYGYSISLVGDGVDKEIIVGGDVDINDLFLSNAIISGIRVPEKTNDLFLFQVRVWR